MTTGLKRGSTDSFFPLILSLQVWVFLYPLSMSASSFLFLLTAHTQTCARTAAADPVPLCGLPTWSRGHGWLKQWQVDSTLKLSIDPREPNQTANPPSLSARDLGGTKGEDTPRVRGQTPPQLPHCTPAGKTAEQLRWNSWLSDVISSRLCGFIQPTL